VIPRTAEAVFKAQRVFTDAFRSIETIFGANALTVPQGWSPRTFIFFTTLPTSRSNPEINRKTRESMLRLIEIGAANGWGEYRAPPEFQDPIVAAYSFGDHSLRRFNEQMKDAVDPNGILAPGRGGIWPKRYRRSRT
jgi:(+)-pinoresinol hydroxylase